MTPINQAMLRLAALPNTLFVGQSVKFSGTAMYSDLDGVPNDRRIEFPVAEDLQLGFCTGLSLQGYLPICIFPRLDFMMRAMDQLINHLDKLAEMSCGQFCPKVIIRTRVGSKVPLNAGPQHTQNHSFALGEMLTNIDVFNLIDFRQIELYDKATTLNKSSLFVENF